MMFHLAPPEVNGLGSMTSTPGLTRSSQVRMFLGLPLRTTNTTTDLVIMPLCWSAFQSLATRPASTSLVMSGSREKVTTSATRVSRSPPPDPPAPPQPAASRAAATSSAAVNLARPVIVPPDPDFHFLYLL